jgi:hypothetical protein
MHVPFVSLDMPKSSKSSKKGSSKSKKTSTTVAIPKSLTATLERIRTKVESVEGQFRDFTKEFRTQAKAWTKMGEKSNQKRAKRKPSEYNLYLKDKMKQGMTMTEAVGAWKQRGGSSSLSSSMSGSSTSSSLGEDDSESGTEEEN